MSDSFLGVNKDLGYLIISDGKATEITENVIMSELIRDFNRGAPIKDDSISAAVLELIDPKRAPSGVTEDVTHEIWPALHSNLLSRVLDSANMAHTAKHKLVELMLSIGGPEQESRYREYLDNSMDVQELDQRYRLGKFRKCLETACDKGFHNVVQQLSWIGAQDLKDLHENTGFEKISTAHRFVGALQNMTESNSGVALADMFKTVDLMIEMGYDIETFQRNDIQEQLELKMHVDGVLFGVAQKALPRSNQSIELMGYLVSKGADPWIKDKNGNMPGDLITSEELRNQWNGVIRAIEIKDAAMDVLRELGINMTMRFAA